MKILDKIIHADGSIEEREIEVADNYFDPTTPPPTIEQDLMALTVDHEYRITLLELGGF